MASEREIKDVINTLIAESIGEGPEGMRRIAETILNRAEQRGISPAEVVRQRSQYTGYSNPGPAAIRAQSDPASISAAQAAWDLAQGPDDPTNGANHYWNPSIVNPSWAGGMTQLGQFGNHAFASDRPSVASQLNVQRTAPTVASPSPLMAASRSMTSPTGGDTGLQAALNAYAIRERNRVEPASAEDRVTARNTAPMNSALQTATRRAALSANPSYAGQDRAPQSMFSGDPGTPSAGRVVATIPTRSMFSDDPGTPAAGPVVYRLPTSQSYAAQDAAKPVKSSTIIGNPPTTRSVQSVPVPKPATQNPILAPAVMAPTLAETRDEQAMMRSQRAIPDRLMPSPENPPGYFQLFSPNHVNQIGKGVQTAAAPAPIQPPMPPSQAQISAIRQGAPLMAASAPVLPRQAPMMASAAKPPLRIVVSPAQVQAPVAPKPSTPLQLQGYTNNGSGKLTSNSTGGVYYERHLL